MASTPPDPHPDSPPRGPADTPDELTPEPDTGRESIEDVPEEDADDETPLEPSGIPDGNAGTGGENKVQGSSFER